MKKPRIYLDTSVISHLDAQDAPEKTEDTRKLWKLIQANQYDVVVSSVVFDELARCAEPKRNVLAGYLAEIEYLRFQDSDETLRLAERFVDFQILRQKNIDDCRHIAAAIVTGCDLIISWNFKHIVNPKTIKGVKVVTTLEGYKDLIICTPTMLVEGDINDE